MAEPLSTAAAVAGLVSLAIQLSQLSFQYVSSLKGSSKAWSSYIQELSALTSVLLKVQQASDAAGTQDLQAVLPGPSISSSTVRECEAELNELRTLLSEKLQKRGILGKLEMLAWPFSETETAKRVEILHRFSGLFSSSLVADILTVSIANYRHLQDMKDVKEFEELLSWLEPKCDPLCISLETIAEEICPGTRKAILESGAYLDWRGAHEGKQTKPLWAGGPPGCGKTHLSAAIVNDTLSNCPDATLSYHFFRDSHPESIADVLRHLVYQHLSQPTGASKLAVDLHRKSKTSKAPLLPKDLVKILCDVASTSRRVYIILDGVDEFPHFAKLMKHIPEFVAARAHVLVASRDLPTIKGFLPDAVVLDARADKADIDAYISWRLEEECELSVTVFTTELKEEICVKLVGHVNGSFLLTRLLMDQICRVTTIKKLRKTLESLPLNYEEAYKNTLDRILKQDRERQELARRAMHWVCTSRRPLDMNELQHAIASLDDDDPGYGEEDLETEKSILSSCFGILLHSKSSRTVELVHSSAREFILGQLELDSQVSHITIGRACLRYMFSAEMAKGPCISLQDLKVRLTKMPFLEYATRYYGNHVRGQDELLRDLLAFLSNDNLRQSSWQLLHFVFSIDSQSAQGLIESMPKGASVLHVACYWGFSLVLKEVLNTKPSRAVLDLADSHGWTGLHWAASCGHTGMVGSLLDAGASINSVDCGDWTPLFWGVVKGHASVVSLLLERGANLSHTDGSGFTPLHWSVLSGAEEITALLLEHGKKVGRDSIESKEEQSVPARTLTVELAKALQAPKKFKDFFKLTTQTSNMDGFKQLAASFEQYGWKGYYDAGLNIRYFDKVWDRTKVILSKGEGRLWSNMRKKSPIDAVRCKQLTNAIKCEDVEMVKSILQLSVDMNKDLSSDVVSENGAAYVHVAAYSGSTEIMQMLIDRRLSLNVTDKRGMAPLHYACRTGTSQIVEMILRSGVDVDARVEILELTPLMVLLHYGAWRTCHSPGETLRILQALVASGASIHARDAGGNRVIHHAMRSYDPTVIQALLDLGADPGAMSDDLTTPLHAMAQGYVGYGSRGNLEMEGFRRKVYDVKVPSHLREAVVKLLLQVSPLASFTATTKRGSSALALAIHNGDWVLSQALYQAGAPFLTNNDLSEDLDRASEQGFFELARLLLRHGAKPKAENILAVISVMVPAEKPHLWTMHLSGLDEHPKCFPLRDHALVLRDLLAAGVNINQESSLPNPYWKMTVIQIAAERGVDAKILAALLEGGADPFAKTREGMDSFLLALVCGKEDNFTVLHNHAAADDLSRDHWLTSWLRKPDANRTSTFNTYMSAIHDAGLVNGWDENGHSLLFHAVGRGNQLLASELLKLGADPNFADPLGWTPFHEAVRTENIVLAKLLVSHGADVFGTMSDINAYSAFSPSEAMPYQEPEAAAINCLHGAVGVNPHPMDLEARRRLSPEMVGLLLELGLDPNGKTRNTTSLKSWDLREEETPLQIMFRKWRYTWDRKFFEVVQMLIDAGADVEGIADRMTPTDVANFEGYEGLWEIFRTAGAAVKNVGAVPLLDTALEAMEGVLPS